MKTNVNPILVMALLLGGFSASAKSADPYFGKRQADAIKSQESFIRAGNESSQISKEVCVYLVQSLVDMRKSAYVVAASVGGESSQLDQLIQLKLMTADECK